MLRHTCARSGRCRRWSAVALRTTSQPSSSPAASASSSVATRPGVPQVDAVGTRAARAARRGQVACPPGGRMSSSLTKRRAAARSTRLGGPARPSGVPQPHGVLDDAGQGPDGGLDGGVRRHRAAAGAGAGDVGHAQQLGDALGAEERRHDRLVGLLADGGEHVGDVLAGDVERRDVDRPTTASTSGSSMAASRASSKSSAVGVGAERHLRLTTRPTALAASAASSPRASELPTIATRRPRGQRLVGEQLGDVEHLLEGVDLDHPGLPEHRVDGLRRRRDLAHGVAHRDALGGAARSGRR